MGSFPASHALGKNLVGAIADIGRDNFATSTFICLRHAARADMFSAFVRTREGQVSLICAEGTEPKQSNPVDLSLRYASEYWQRDPMMSDPAATGKDGILRQSRSSIADSEYRNICYQRPNVIERVSACAARERDLIFLNIYRRAESGIFADEDLDGFRQIALALSACVGSHDRVVRQRPSLRPSPAVTMRALRSADPRLSAREAEICAGILCGEPLKAIASARSLELSSVITYKKRAFEKLKISTRRELREICERGLRELSPAGDDHLQMITVAGATRKNDVGSRLEQ